MIQNGYFLYKNSQKSLSDYKLTSGCNTIKLNKFAQHDKIFFG